METENSLPRNVRIQVSFEEETLRETMGGHRQTLPFCNEATAVRQDTSRSDVHKVEGAEFGDSCHLCCETHALDRNLDLRRAPFRAEPRLCEESWQE